MFMCWEPSLEKQVLQVMPVWLAARPWDWLPRGRHYVLDRDTYVYPFLLRESYSCFLCCAHMLLAHWYFSGGCVEAFMHDDSPMQVPTFHLSIFFCRQMGKWIKHTQLRRREICGEMSQTPILWRNHFEGILPRSPEVPSRIEPQSLTAANAQ